MLSRYLTFFIIVFFTSCAKEFRNPYDPATPPDIWMPKAFKLDTLGTNALRLSWNQDERHIDGFAIQKSTNGQLKEILLPLDSLRYTDTQAVDTSLDEVCPELSYKVMARAGNNRSLDIGTALIRLPFSTFANAGADQTITSNITQVTLDAISPATDESGTWTIISGIGGSFSNILSPSSIFSGNICSSYTLRWTIQGECSSDFDDVNISFQQFNTIANAGIDQTLPSNVTQVNLSANAPSNGEIGQWNILNGTGGSLSNPNIPNAVFTGILGSNYILRWSITGACNTNSDDLSINLPSLASAGAGVTDIDGNFYSTIILSSGREWTTTNLRTSKYCNGAIIPDIIDLTEWTTLSSGARSIYNNDNQYEGDLGYLYNWFAVADSRNICPCGWHVPSNSDWDNLVSVLGGDMMVIGNLLKSVSWGGPNLINFSAEPEGFRIGDNGYFFGLNNMAVWWSKTSQNATQASYYQIDGMSSQLLLGSDVKLNGNSVRCVRD